MSKLATKTYGGRITGHLALTVEATVALQENDDVMLTGDYTVGLADGSKPSIGHVSVRNVKRISTATTSQFPVGDPGGDVTVEARGWNVRTKVSGGAITAGHFVKIDNTGALVDGGVVWNVANVGIALIGATAAGQTIDVLSC
jgi:hypothetical protein